MHTNMATPSVWLITGASSGIGLELAKVAASQGHRVIATSRDPGSKLSGIVEGIEGTIEAARLDHNEPLDRVRASVDAIVARHGAPDVVVNNAAYVQAGTVEETTPDETLRQFRANAFGPVDVYRAVLPSMRGAGAECRTLVTVGSMAAWYPMDGVNLYNASKAALRRLVLGLAAEVRPLSIRHCLVEPGFFRTDLLRPGPDANLGMTTTAGGGASRIADYDDVNREADRALADFHGAQRGDPVRGARVVYDIITSSGAAAGRDLPARRSRDRLYAAIPKSDDVADGFHNISVGDISRQLKQHMPSLTTVEVPSFEKFMSSPSEHYPYEKTFEEARNEPVVVLHSSGSTGLPKPITLTHGSLAVLDNDHNLSELSPSSAVVVAVVGYLGRHLVAKLLPDPHVSRVFCLNRAAAAAPDDYDINAQAQAQEQQEHEHEQALVRLDASLAPLLVTPSSSNTT
ncbi:hypothetical protein GGR56DRAFT_686675 [Xylariaceae sp. FL0804]|nr:hypothetical protein GGR56DRAFT_686675 [Xylariaceae sp. FL0804]